MSGGRTIVAAALAGLAWAPGALAAPAAPTVDELVVTAPKSIAELTVTARIKCAPAERTPGSRDRPRVVSTYPARGAVVRPGLIVLRVTFDQPMTCSGRFVGAGSGADPCPTGTQDLLLSFDRRTVRTACAAAPDAHYGVALNPDLEGRDLFMGMAGLPAQRHTLDFTTSAGPLVTSVCEALEQDAETSRQLAQAHRSLGCGAPPPGGG